MTCATRLLVETMRPSSVFARPPKLNETLTVLPSSCSGTPAAKAGVAITSPRPRAKQTFIADLQSRLPSRGRGQEVISSALSLHRRIDQPPQQRADVFALAGALHHEHDEHVFHRIDKEERAGHSAPVELTDRAGERRHALIGADRKAEAEAVTGRHQGRVDLDPGAEMVGRPKLP